MLLFWALVIPFGTAVLALLAWRSLEMQRGISLIGALALLVLTVRIAIRVATEGPFAEQAGGWPAPYGITLVADGLSAVMVLLTGLVAVAVLIFSFSDVTEGEKHYGFYPLTHALLAGICGAFLTGDIFNMYVWFEVMLIASFGLLVVGGGKAQLDGAIKYVGLNLIATVAFIAGVGLLYGATGALNMADLHGRLMGRGAETPILASAAVLIFAFGSKAALFPVFFWLPASYHTPAFSTSALFAALLTKVGVYALIRVFTLVYDIDGTPIAALLLGTAVLTMAVGAFGALSQTSIRRVLGYSIVSSIGYMILGLAVATPLAVTGALFYLFQDVLVKANLFLSAGATKRLAGSEEFGRAGGIWRVRPWFSLLFLIPALSLAGVPPFSGFWAKLLLARATIEIGSAGLTFMVLGVGFLTLFAMARIWAAVFWSAHPEGDGAITERLPAAMLVPLLALTGAIVYIGIDAGPMVEGAAAIATGLIDPQAYVAAVLGGAE
ncbi:proton-conducting transporter membrane subunit [Amaricoccus sp.]|uniref:proton-conducting transporter transmembrane domain-containing protein n=1 Tax=Amaricoccus sp. TaxID=1872485 RepID=UPI002C529C56|nr:proton-conducting transporter membrane subunit [Amaricoccus sp.]HRW14244.1 proton-conducting transporter membrane subunit [Amaricoccus sp.]